jgi:hypothetical protein
MTAFQVICMVAGSFGDSYATAGLSVTLQWLSVLRLVRLPRAFSIVKARLLSIPAPAWIYQAGTLNTATNMSTGTGWSFSIHTVRVFCGDVWSVLAASMLLWK